jgi:hypothetical protein
VTHTFSGGIGDFGTINSGDDGIDVVELLTFSGGISNSGSIVSVTDAGILVENGDTFSGGINNSGAVNTNDIINPRGISLKIAVS